MRWFWIDRFEEFHAGRRAKAVKCVSLVEEYIDEYFSGYPVMTPTFVLEGFAQMGGLLVGQRSDFLANIVLAKVSGVKVHFYARPGDTLHYSVEVQNLTADGGFVVGQSHVNGQLQVEAELTFAQVGRDVFPGDFFDHAEFLRMLRIFGLYKVGMDDQGQPLTIPPHLLAAERAARGE